MDPLTNQVVSAVLQISNGPILAVCILCIIHLYRLEKSCGIKYDKLLEELARAGCIQQDCPKRRASDRREDARYEH